MLMYAEVGIPEIAYEVSQRPKDAFDLVRRIAEYIADSDWDDRVIAMLRED
jgi:hypothetical protein